MNTRWLQLCVFTIGVFVIATPDPNFKARLYSSALEFLSKTTEKVVSFEEEHFYPSFLTLDRSFED